MNGIWRSDQTYCEQLSIQIKPGKERGCFPGKSGSDSGEGLAPCAP